MTGSQFILGSSGHFFAFLAQHIELALFVHIGVFWNIDHVVALAAALV